MKLLDKYKLSLHNIKNNKSRSILTTVIVYIISLLIMIILCVGISFSINTSNIIKTYYQTSNEPVKIQYYNYGSEGNVLDSNVYLSLSSVLEKNKEMISYTSYSENSGYSNDLYIQEHKFPVTESIEIIEGRNVNGKDSKTNRVVVSANYAQEYYNKTNNLLKPGSILEYVYENYIYNEDGSGYLYSKALNLEVVGIYKHVETNKEKVTYSRKGDIIIDAGYLINNVDDLYYSVVEYFYNMPKSNFNDKEITQKLGTLVSELKDVLPDGSRDYDSVNCMALEELNMTKTIGIVIIAFAAFLCLVLILLSIGSLANTIMISVDKNKKFIGLLKALGLNEKDLKSTIKMESVTTISIGIALSFITIFLFKGLIASLNELLLGSMFSSYLSEIEYTILLSLPIYIPIIVLVFFVFFTLLFARGSMSKIAKTDPMAVISEVA